MIKIAICDDEANIRAYLSSLIGAQSCPCEIVEYASAGDCLADTQKIDLLFLDIELAPSSLDGMALARKIRERATVTQPVIIFVTGYERYALSPSRQWPFAYTRWLAAHLCAAHENDSKKSASTYWRCWLSSEEKESYPIARIIRKNYRKKTRFIDG